MSVRPRDRKNSIKSFKQEDKIRTNLSNIIDNINYNSLAHYYPKDESLFKKRIDKLNYKFYIETEKYLTNKNDMERCQDQLFVILFKQISLYIEEVERLNILLREKTEDEKSFKEKLEELTKKEREKSANHVAITNLRTSNKNFEKKLEDKNKSEEKLRNENESLQRQIKFYKEQLETNLNLMKTHEVISVYSSKKRMNFDDNAISSHNNSLISNVDFNVRSASKESQTKKVSISVTATTTGNTLNSVDKESTKSKSNCNSNSNLNIDSQVQGIMNKNLTQSKISLNVNDSLNVGVSKILNKKRNYSDNNPNGNNNNNGKKNVIIVVKNLNQQNSNVDNIVPVSNDNVSRENNKSSVPHKSLTLNIANSNSSNIKSPERITPNFHPNNENSANSIKSFYAPNSNINTNIPSNTNSNTIANSSSSVSKKPTSDGKMLNMNMYKQTSKHVKDFKIIKSIKVNNRKTDSQDNNERTVLSNYDLMSPKAQIGSKSIFESGMVNFNNSNSFLNSSSLNENFLQDHLMNTLTSFDEELAYLNDLEKMLRNTKIMSYTKDKDKDKEKDRKYTHYANNNYANIHSNNNPDKPKKYINANYSINANYNINPPQVNSNKSKCLLEVSKRSESLENNVTGAGFLFSDEENEGYKSGASFLSDKQSKSNFYSNSMKIKSQLSNNNFKKSESSLISNLNAANTGNTGTTSASLAKNKIHPLLTSVTIDLMDSETHKNNKSSSTISKRKIDIVGYLNKLKK